jgi:hypothetical protein
MNTTALAFLVIVLPIAFAAIGTITVRRAMHGKVKEGHNASSSGTRARASWRPPSKSSTLSS